jgi:hypothetical protein
MHGMQYGAMMITPNSHEESEKKKKERKRSSQTKKPLEVNHTV